MKLRSPLIHITYKLHTYVSYVVGYVNVMYLSNVGRWDLYTTKLATEFLAKIKLLQCNNYMQVSNILHIIKLVTWLVMYSVQYTQYIASYIACTLCR